MPALSVRHLLALGLAVAPVLIPLPAVAQQDEADRLYAQGIEARHGGRIDEAIRLLRAAAELRPDSADVLVQLGLALTASGDLEAAGSTLRRVLEIAPGYTDARIGLARIAVRRGRLDEAQQTLAPVLSAEPNNADARAVADQIAAARRDGAERRAADLRRQQEQREAEREARRRAELERLTREARTLRIQGRFKEAIAKYSRALALSPGNIDLLVGLGLAQASAGDHVAAQASFRQVLERDRDSVDARLGMAILAVRTGNRNEAEALVDAVLADAPENAEALALRARLQLARGQAREAEAAFSASLATAPRNADALVGLGDARRALWDEQGAREAYESALRIDPASAEARARLAEKPEPRWQLDVDGLRSNLSGGLEPWNEVAVRLGYRVTRETTISGGIELSERFGDFDTYFEGRVDHRFTPSLAGYALLGGTPDADFRANYQVGIGGSARVSSGNDGFMGATIAMFDLRHAAYGTGTIQTASPGVEQHLFGGRVWLTGRWINTFDPDRGRIGGWSVRADVQATDRLRVFVGLADAPDISEGIVLETFSVFGGLVVDLDRNVSLRLSLAREDRDRAYDRTVLGIGMGVRF
jgi:YaiO family outer membrane protein